MNFGFWEILIILVIVLVMFGAGKLPRLMGDFAQGIKAFKKGMKDDDDTGTAEPVPPVTGTLPRQEPPAGQPAPASQGDQAARG